MFNVLWQLKPLTFTNLRIPHSIIYGFAAENKFITNLQDLGILKSNKYMVAIVKQFIVSHQLVNIPLTIYKQKLFNGIWLYF